MATSEHTEVPGGGHKAAFPPFARETFPSQVLWLTLSFVLLYVLVWKLILPRVGSILESRSQRIADDLAMAERNKAEADAAIAAYEKSLAEARARAQSLANDVRQKQVAQAEETRKTLEQQLNRKLAEAEKAITATKNAAMTKVAGIASDAAAAIVERLIGKGPDPKDVAAAVGDALKQR
jgi:F-type H+-transporting ATPase subunit b